MGLSSFIASQAKSEFLQDDNQNFLLRKRAAPIERSENRNRAMVSRLIPPMETEVGRNERLRAASLLDYVASRLLLLIFSPRPLLDPPLVTWHYGGNPAWAHAVSGVAPVRESQEAREGPGSQGHLGRLHLDGDPPRHHGNPRPARLRRGLYRTPPAILAALASRLREGTLGRRRFCPHPRDSTVQSWTRSGIPARQDRG